MLSVLMTTTRVTDVRLDVQTNVRRSLTCVETSCSTLDVFNVPFGPCLIRGGRRRSVCGRLGGMSDQ
jgi:hypothetical protein